MTIKVALAGAGAFGVKHLEGIRNIDGVEVISLISRDTTMIPARSTRASADRMSSTWAPSSFRGLQFPRARATRMATAASASRISRS